MIMIEEPTCIGLTQYFEIYRLLPDSNKIVHVPSNATKVFSLNQNKIEFVLLLKNIVFLKFAIIDMFATFLDKIESVEFTIIGLRHIVAVNPIFYCKQMSTNNYVFIDRETTE